MAVELTAAEILKDGRAEKKRRAILDQALTIFAREGFARTDVQVIADLAGVGKGTVYRHFGNKRELFLATARHSLERLGAFIREQVKPDAPTIEVLRGIAMAYALYFERHPEAVEIMIQERAAFRNQVFPTHLMYRAENREEFERFLQAAVDRGDLKPIPLSDLSEAFGDLLYGTVVNGCLEGSRGNLLERMERRMKIFFEGVVASGVLP